MKILVVEGSPHPHGNSGRIVDELLAGAGGRGHEVTRLRAYDLAMKGCTGCMACKTGKVEYCVHDDDFLANVDRIVGADLFVFATPVYFGQVTGPFKTFLDRWCTFFDAGFRIRLVSGKKFVTVTTSGAAAERYADVSDYLNEWFGDFFKMERIGAVVAGGLMKPGDAESASDVLAQARAIGQRL